MCTLLAPLFKKGYMCIEADLEEIRLPSAQSAGAQSALVEGMNDILGRVTSSVFSVLAWSENLCKKR